jgi:hypothetical protein
MTSALRYHGRMFSRREILAGAAAATAQTLLSQAARRPNVVLFLADDLGCHDLGAWGAADLETPNIDALAAGGARFTNWYAAAPVCAPSRAGLLTGRYPIRAGVPLMVRATAVGEDHRHGTKDRGLRHRSFRQMASG